MPQLIASLLAAVLLLLPAGHANAALPSPQHYRCDSDPLVATVHGGAVDAVDIPNSLDGTLPGSFIVLEWRGVSLQLPRTNNAGSPSYTDGRWFWRVDDSAHPEFTEWRGAVRRYPCQPDTTP